jgi:threonine dehydrogenase-like Zn-dependent dehydrogenase
MSTSRRRTSTGEFSCFLELPVEAEQPTNQPINQSLTGNYRNETCSVPEGLSDREAAFAEPLAAALRVAEQRALPAGCSVAVVGDGKLGLLVAAVLSKGGHAVTLLGRHPEKMALAAPCGVGRAVVAGAATAAELAGAFDAAVEASGSAAGARLALAVCAPLGTVVLKSTCAVVGGGVGGGAAGAGNATAAAKSPPPALVEWPEIGNDAVVNEKTLVGSRCGPIGAALDLLAADADVRALVNAMVEAEVPLAEGVAAVARAGRRGAMKVQVVTPYGVEHAI